MKFVNAYLVTREYGGPEEGGWYFDKYDVIQVFPVETEEHAEKVQSHMIQKYEHLDHGDISSVLSGAEVRVYIEDEPAEMQTLEKPIYE